MKLRYAVVYEETPNNYCAYAPDVPGCVSTGKTWKKMQEMIRESLTFHIEFMLEKGDLVPEPRMSLDEAMVFHSQILVGSEDEFFEGYDEVSSLSTTFSMVEIEVAIPSQVQVDDTVPQSA